MTVVGKRLFPIFVSPRLSCILKTWLCCCDNLDSFEKGLGSVAGYITSSKTVVGHENIDEVISKLLSLLRDIDLDSPQQQQTVYKQQELMERTENLKELWNNRFPPAPSLTPMEKKKKKKGRNCLAKIKGTGCCVAGGAVIGMLTATEVIDRVGTKQYRCSSGWKKLGRRLKKPLAGETWVKKTIEFQHSYSIPTFHVKFK